MSKYALLLLLLTGCGDVSSPCGVCGAPRVCAAVTYYVPCTMIGMPQSCPVSGHMCIDPAKVIKNLDEP